MAIMTRMRDNMPVILIGLVVVFIITIVFEWGMDYLGLSRTNDTVGIIDGKKISYQEFSELVRQQSDQYKQQTKKDPDDNTIKQIRDQVWNNLVTQDLLKKETDKAGITVTDQEIVDWVRGENPPDFLVQQFRDSTGQFRRDAYEEALNNPQNREIWIQVENALRQQRLAEKMQSVVFSTIHITEGEVRERFVDQSIKANLQYAYFNPDRFISDSAVTVTDDDLKKVYNENREEFKVQPSRKLKYVLFSDQPSAKDSQAVLDEINSVLSQAKSGIDFMELQKEYVDKSPAPAFFKHGELARDKEDEIFNAKVGDIVGPVADYDGYHLYKVLDTKKEGEMLIKARHILLKASTPEEEASSKKLANELIARAKKGEDFAALAREYSIEPGAAQSGGELGWFGKGRMVKPFEEAAFSGHVGQIIGPVKTQFGIHIIKIEGRDNKQVKVATITIPVVTSSQTKDDAYQRAQDFAYVAKKGSFESEAQSLGLKVMETPEFQKGTMVPGIGVSDAINKFAFKSSVGDISDAYTVNNGYVIVKVVEVTKEGVRPFDEVKASLKPRALRNKKMAQLKSTVEKKYSMLGENGDLSTLSSDPNISVQTTGEFGVNSSIPGIGREYAMNGIARTGEVGKILPPVQGLRGYYLVKIISRTPFDTASYNAKKSVLESQILQERKQTILADWLAKLKENASIEDNRDTFFR